MYVFEINFLESNIGRCCFLTSLCTPIHNQVSNTALKNETRFRNECRLNFNDALKNFVKELKNVTSLSSLKLIYVNINKWLLKTSFITSQFSHIF